MTRYPPAFIEEVKSRLDIAAVISRYVKLKRQGSGARHVGLCPFHSDKTPSFTVNSDWQTYKCFGCDAGGDVIAFLQEIEQVSFPEALRMCADFAGVPIAERPQAGPLRPFYSAELIAEAELWRTGLLWRIDRALTAAKAALWTDQHKAAIRTTRGLTRHLASVQRWTPRECVDKARLADPQLVRSCVDEARELEMCLASVIAAAGASQALESAAA